MVDDNQTKKDFGWLIYGIVIGGIFGLIINIWTSIFIEWLKNNFEITTWIPQLLFATILLVIIVGVLTLYALRILIPILKKEKNNNDEFEKSGTTNNVDENGENSGKKIVINLSNAELILEQYKQTQENQRSLVRLLWEIPAIAIAISSAFLVVSYKYFVEYSINNLLIRTGLLFFGSLLMFVVFLAVVKHRHFRGVWLEELEKMEKNMGLNPVPMWTYVTKKTNRYKETNKFHKEFLDFSAEEWLANVVIIISAILLILSGCNLGQLIFGLINSTF